MSIEHGIAVMYKYGRVAGYVGYFPYVLELRAVMRDAKISTCGKRYRRFTGHAYLPAIAEYLAEGALGGGCLAG